MKKITSIVLLDGIMIIEEDNNILSDKSSDKSSDESLYVSSHESFESSLLCDNENTNLYSSILKSNRQEITNIIDEDNYVFEEYTNDTTIEEPTTNDIKTTDTTTNDTTTEEPTNSTTRTNNENVINIDLVPEVEAQQLTFFDRTLPIAFGYNPRDETEERIHIDRNYCLCIPYNKETDFSDKMCECCICLMCPVTLALKTCLYSLSAVCLTTSYIEKAFCPEFGRRIFGIQEPILTSCLMYMVEKVC